MDRLTFVAAALVAALPALTAQEKKPDDAKKIAPGSQTTAQQSPKAKEHDALKTLVGSFDVTHKMTLAGADKPVEEKATAHAELILGGLWLKSNINGTHEGKPFQGVWLVGYDPFKSSYRTVWVSNCDPAPTDGEGRYDEKTKTWEFSGKSSMGEYKTTAVVKDADTIVETGTCTMDGKEGKMEIVYKRSRAPVAVESSARPASAPSKDHEGLLNMVGAWDATMKMAPQPGAPVAEMPGNERVVPICEGHYVWSEYRMQFQGQPFTGHALCGYDSNAKKYVSYWFDSMTPVVSQASGTFDPASKTLTLTGTSRDPSGKPTTTKQTETWKDANTRHMKMECTGEKTESFEITFKRKEGK